MKVSYDAIKRMITQALEEMGEADKNQILAKFINQLDTLEKASKGNLKKKVQEGGGGSGKYVPSKKIKVFVRPRVVLDADEKIPETRRLDKSTLMNVITKVLEEEEFMSRGEITKKREELYPGWKNQRQLALGIVEKKKEKKKNCSPGAVFHNADGEFSSKQDAKVYSLKFAGKGKSNCKRGQAKIKNGKELFTKLPCGRGDEEGTTKAKYKCKDGEPASE